MSFRRRPPAKRVLETRRVRKAGSLKVTRAEFAAVIKLLNEQGEIIQAIHGELHTQFARIAQLQQELDTLKRRT